MASVTCSCGEENELLAVRRAADEFCNKCDYPLFWESSAVPITTPGGNLWASQKRLPGVGGRRRVGGKVCPEPTCRELNPTENIKCSRCNEVLNPPALPPEPEPEPEPAVFVPLPLTPMETTKWWVWWVLGGALSACVIVPIIYENLN